MSRFCQTTALLLLAAVLATNVYRAATQSFTSDEAFSANMYVNAPVRGVLTEYDANNHVLHTLLMRISAAALGATEFTLRIPSLLGGASYLAAALVLARRLAGRGPLFLLTFATLALNPFVLDFLSAARGYGMALGFFLWSLYFLDRYFDRPDSSRLAAAAVMLALSVAANLTLAIPGVALVAVVSAVLLLRRQYAALVDQLLLPGIAVAFVFLAIPLAHSRPGDFYAGAASLENTLDGLVVASLYHSTPDQTDTYATLPLLRRVLRIAAAPVVKAVCLLLAAALAWMAVRRRGAALTPPERFLALAGGSLLGAALIAELLHHTLGFPYPEMRTALYLLPLFSLAAFALAQAPRHALLRRGSVAAAVVFFGLCLAQFALDWNARFYFEWPHDAEIKTAMRKLRNVTAAQPAPPRVGVSPHLEATATFYARLYRIPMNPLSREGPVEGRDYYLLADDDRALAARRGLRTIFEDHFGKLVLAERPR